MSLTGLLVSAGSATTNPNPNSLSTVSPFPATYAGAQKVSTAWATQAKPALFPTNLLGGVTVVGIPVEFIPSVANAVYTVTLWRFNRIANVWVQPKDGASFTLTGNQYLPIDNPGDDPLFLQLSNISSGTVAMYYDAGLARAL